MLLLYNELRKYDTAISYAKMGITLADSIGIVDAEAEGYKSRLLIAMS